jgi:hypothetical protein
MGVDRNPLPKRGNTTMACSACKSRKQRVWLILVLPVEVETA